MIFDSMPIWAFFLLTLVLVSVALEVGFRIGRHHQARGAGKVEGAGAMVGATMGLLAFMLAFTFNSAAVRYEARKMLVVEEANAIHQTWLRAGLVSEPGRTEVRGMLREYVEVRLKAAHGQIPLADALRRSDELQDRMWALALEAGRKDPGSITAGLFISSVNELIDLHLKRVTIGTRHRVPGTIWVTLFLLTSIAMAMMGAQVGLSGARHLGIELALALAFSAVLYVIADLDRPQQGFVTVSQQALIELERKLNAHH